jgi:hypothetical protein
MFTEETYHDNVAGEYRLTLRGHQHPADTSIPNRSRRVDKKYLAKTDMENHRLEDRKESLGYLQKLMERSRPTGQPSVPRKTKRPARIRTKTVASARKEGNK